MGGHAWQWSIDVAVINGSSIPRYVNQYCSLAFIHLHIAVHCVIVAYVAAAAAAAAAPAVSAEYHGVVRAILRKAAAQSLPNTLRTSYRNRIH